MLRRPLVYVLALAVGDYLLWNWSLNGDRDVLALVSGLTLPPLALVAVWLLAVSGTRLLSRLTRRTPAPRQRPAGAAASRERHGAARASGERPSRKLAA